jgi:DNA-binding NarL/FixJ family response regulator
MLAVPCQIERMGLRDFVERCPRYEVVAEVADGQTALRMARDAAPHIAVIEHGLSDITGLGLSHMLFHYHPRIEVLLHTNRTSEDDVIEALRAGVRGFVLKSAAEQHLIPALDALAEHRPYWDGAIEEEVFQRLVGGPPRTSNGLTTRERQVIQLVAEGHSTKAIADILNVTTKTVDTFRTALRRKLRLRTMADLVRYAVSHGIVD